MIAIHPFYSQIDKLTGQFSLSTCGAAKQLAWVAERLQSELQEEVAFIVPQRCDVSSYGPLEKFAVREVRIPPCNVRQRVHFDTDELLAAYRGVDLALCNHEMMALPLRQLFPKLPIITMLNVGFEPQFVSSILASDLVVTQGQYAKRMVAAGFPDERITCWSLAYDEDDFGDKHRQYRDVDALFVQRCSPSNYTHHREFLKALPLMRHVRAAFTDVTRYLRAIRTDLKYSTPATYLQTLYRSRVAVALNDNAYGGLAIREAVRAGCVPVVLDSPCYLELVGEDWPFLVRTLDPQDIADTVNRALAWKGPLPNAPRENVLKESYQAGWPHVKEDVDGLLRRAR